MLNRILNRTPKKMCAPSIAVLLVLVLVLSGCVPEEKDEKGAGAPPAAKVVYASGFYDEERTADNAWRWMEPTGIVRLRNTGKDMELTITGRPPVEQFKQAPTITFTLNGAKLDEYKGSSDVVTKTFVVTPAQQGSGEWSELKISTDMSFVPKEVDQRSTDGRSLAFSLTGLTWKMT